MMPCNSTDKFSHHPGGINTLVILSGTKATVKFDVTVNSKFDLIWYCAYKTILNRMAHVSTQEDALNRISICPTWDFG